MLLIESPPLEPREAVALDELLLDKAVAGQMCDCLRLWTTERTFVVMGRGGRAGAECHGEACARDGVEILRRSSGGGTVLLAPGGLHYAVVLPSARLDSRLEDVKESYRWILGRMARGFQAHGLGVQIQCCADLALGEFKISGNAQLRRRRKLLHHGTLLCEGFDLDLVGKYLRHPPREPRYRGGRPHEQFMTRLPMSVAAAAEIVRESFAPFEGTWRPDGEDLARLKDY